MALYGKNLARILKLKKDRTHTDRWQTEWGTKSNIGLYLTVKRLILDMEEGCRDPELIQE
jgi:hypothetical protein